MRANPIFSIFVIVLLCGTFEGCGKNKSGQTNGNGSDNSNLTDCEKAIQDWSKIWTATPEQTGLTGDTPNNDLMDIWASGWDDIYVVGFAGTILHYDGTTWSQMISNTTENLHGVWGYIIKDSTGAVTTREIFAVGENGMALRYSSGTWSPLPVLDPTNNNSTVTDDVNDVWGIAPEPNGVPTVIAVGAGGLILHYDSATNSFYEVKKRDENNNTLYDRWVTSELDGVFGNSLTDFVAVGHMGVIINIDTTGIIDTTCQNESCRVSLGSFNTPLAGVWGQAGADVYAVGNEGTVVRRHSGTWSVLNLDTPDLFDGQLELLSGTMRKHPRRRNRGRSANYRLEDLCRLGRHAFAPA